MEVLEPVKMNKDANQMKRSRHPPFLFFNWHRIAERRQGKWSILLSLLLCEYVNRNPPNSLGLFQVS